MACHIFNLRDHSPWLDRAAAWFHDKWGIPLEAYRESMAQCLKKEGAVPQWYIAVRDEEIIGGLGVIENDFHDRKDLSPTCAPSMWRRRTAARALRGRF